MDLYVNNKIYGKIPVLPTTKVSDFKKILNDWLLPGGYYTYTVKIALNNGTEIPEMVFQTNQYDDMDFQAQAHLINGGAILVTIPVPIPIPVPVTLPVTIPVTIPRLQTQNQEDLTMLTIPELKELLRVKGLKVGGKKAELINRLLNPEDKKTITKDKKTITKDKKTKENNYKVGDIVELFSEYLHHHRFAKVVSHTKSGAPRIRLIKMNKLDGAGDPAYSVTKVGIDLDNAEYTGPLISTRLKKNHGYGINISEERWSIVGLYDPKQQYLNERYY